MGFHNKKFYDRFTLVISSSGEKRPKMDRSQEEKYFLNLLPHVVGFLEKKRVDGHDLDPEIFLNPSPADKFNTIAQGELKIGMLRHAFEPLEEGSNIY